MLEFRVELDCDKYWNKSNAEWNLFYDRLQNWLHMIPEDSWDCPSTRVFDFECNEDAVAFKLMFDI